MVGGIRGTEDPKSELKRGPTGKSRGNMLDTLLKKGKT